MKTLVYPALISLLLPLAAQATSLNLQCVGNEGGPEACASLPGDAKPANKTASTLVTKKELSGAAAVMSLELPENELAEESASGTLAMDEGQRANQQSLDLQNLLKSWQAPGSSLPVAATASLRK